MIKICNKNIKVIICILKGPLFNECIVVVDAASIKMCAPISHERRFIVNSLFPHAINSNYLLLSFSILFITKRIRKDNKKLNYEIG